MKILQSNESFRRTGGTIRFNRVRFIVEHDGKYYAGYSKNRRGRPTEFSELENTKEFQTTDRGPKLLSHWTVASPKDDCFVKAPRLDDYLDTELEARIQSEIDICEAIRLNPHPGLATYYGCVNYDGRVSGLCLERYNDTLSERVNPGHLNKSHFIESGRPLVKESMRGWLNIIRDALHHLHSLGIVHNDINPANIMLDDKDRPIVIDFDSASRAGEPLGTRGGTYPWCDELVTHGSPANDLAALDEIEVWLFGSAKDLKYS